MGTMTRARGCRYLLQVGQIFFWYLISVQGVSPAGWRSWRARTQGLNVLRAISAKKSAVKATIFFLPAQPQSYVNAHKTRATGCVFCNGTHCPPACQRLYGYPARPIRPCGSSDGYHHTGDSCGLSQHYGTRDGQRPAPHELPVFHSGNGHG
jgi:hypothetical protein